MAQVSRIIKVKNPRRVRTTKRRSTTGAKKKGPAINRYTVKQLKKALKKRGVSTSTGLRHKRHTRRTKPATKRNPVPILLELGAINPKRRTSVAKRKRSTRRKVARNPRSHSKRVTRVVGVRRRRTRKVANSTARRRRNPAVSRRRTRRVARRRNPALFGRAGGKSMLTMVGGGLVGVAATKFLPTMIPDSIKSSLGSSKLASIAMTGAGAFAAGWLARKFGGQEFGDSVLFGGLMQTGSVVLTAFAPPALAAQLALSGVGDIVPGNFVVPQNPIMAAQQQRAMAAAAAASGPQGVGALRRYGNYRGA